MLWYPILNNLSITSDDLPTSVMRRNSSVGDTKFEMKLAIGPDSGSQ
jgi:hypothetical protein